MAAEGGEDGAAISAVLKTLESDVTCSVCWAQYREPKLLPCAHYFCRRCLQRLAEQRRGKPFPCPLCTETTTLPLGGVDELPTAYFVEHLLEAHRTIDANKEELRGPRKMICDACEKADGVVSSYCKKCDQFLCGGCLERHQTSRLYSGHLVESLDELRAKRERRRNYSILGRSDSIASSTGPRLAGSEDGDGKAKVYALCPRHPDERLKLYCHDHDFMICHDCTVYDHPVGKCGTGFIRDEAPKTRQVLRDALSPIQGAHEGICAAEKDLEAVHDKVCADEAEETAKVRRAFEAIRSRVDSCEAALLGAVENVSQGKKDALQGQKKALEMAKHGVESTIDSVKQDIQHLTDEDMLSGHRQLLMKMEKEVAQHRLLMLEPVTHADLIMVGPSPDDFPMKVGLAYPRLELFQLRIKPPSHVFVGTKANYTITVPHSMDGDIEVEIQSTVDPGCVIRGTVKLLKEREEVLRGVVVAKYDVSFTPRVRGPHTLTTKINREHMTGSPFDIFALIDPSHLGFVIRQSGEAGKPYGIALSPDGLLVTAGNGSKNLRFWNRDLKEVRDPIYSPLFHFPRGVACGVKPGVIYSTDKGVDPQRNYTIMKFVDGVLERGTTYGSRNVRFIKIIRGQLFVADENNSQVHRYSPETLDRIGTFSVSQKASDTHDIAEYNNLLYVLGSSKVATYSFDDRKFVANVPLAATMSLMRGICFDRSGNMFITQAGSSVKGVYVFQTNGRFITSFGHFMDLPMGIVIDDDGFVYVTDHKEKNRRIFCF